MWKSAAECHLQLLVRQVCSVARLCPEQSFPSLCHRRKVVALYLLNKVNSNSNHCLFSELPSASVRVCHTRAAAAANPLEFEVSRCWTSQFARCFLPAETRVWNDLPYTVSDTGTIDGIKGAVNRWLLPWVVFFCFPWRRCLWDCEAILKQFYFSPLGFFPLGQLVLIIIIIIIIIEYYTE